MSVDEVHARRMTSKGQVTIPVEVRRLLKLGPRDRVLFRIADGRVELVPSTLSLEDTFGAVPPLNQPKDFKALRDEAIEEHVANALDKLGR